MSTLHHSATNHSKKKVAVITGASRGLGQAIAHQLAKDHYQLALVARNQDELHAVVDGLHAASEIDEPLAFAFPADLSDLDSIPELVNQIVSQLGQVDVVINNAGIGTYKPFVEHSIEEINAIIDVNLKAPMLICHSVLPTMIKQGRGHIVNIGSDLAQKPLANMVPYVASKHGLYGMSQSLLREAKANEVRVSILNSGIVDSYFGGGSPGQHNEGGALQPEALAKLVSDILHQPGFQLIDEVTVHPLHQDF